MTYWDQWSLKGLDQDSNHIDKFYQQRCDISQNIRLIPPDNPCRAPVKIPRMLFWVNFLLNYDKKNLHIYKYKETLQFKTFKNNLESNF